jgi:hypothetical protein
VRKGHAFKKSGFGIGTSSGKGLRAISVRGIDDHSTLMSAMSFTVFMKPVKLSGRLVA